MTKEELLLEQWKLCVEMADRISQRRSITNSLFTTINLAVMSVYFSFSNNVQIVGAVFLVILNYVWKENIKSYKLLNRAKFKAILEIEKELPYEAFGREWEFSQADTEYKILTDTEKFLPCFFSFFYIGCCCLVVGKLIMGKLGGM